LGEYGEGDRMWFRHPIQAAKARIGEERLGRFRQAVRHPVTWAKGTGYPEERIRPWEYLVQFFGPTMEGLIQGFTDKRDKLYVGEAPGKIKYMQQNLPGFLNSAWDVANDPMIGVYMDRHRYAAQVYRWIMRSTAIWVKLWNVLLLFNFGLTPTQRVWFWCAEGMLRCVFTTANTVAESKLWAGITPHTEQRSKIQLAKTLGIQGRMALSAMYLWIFALQETLHISDYQIILYGALLFVLPSLVGALLPSFAKQRVSFEREPDRQQPSLRESFSIVRHNRMFIINSICGFVTVFTPAIDDEYFYRLVAPKMRVFGKELNGMALKGLKLTIVGTPGTFLQPLARQAIRRVGGERNMLLLNRALGVAQCLITYFIGYKTLPRMFLGFAVEIAYDIVNRWAPVAQGVIDYEMLDYVEWKTGERSEGVTMSVNGLINKLVTSNIGRITQNAYMKWTGSPGWSAPVEEQPERLLKSVWPVLWLTTGFDHLVYLIGTLFYHYDPAVRDGVEADLIERRKLAEAAKAEAELAVT